MAPRLAAIGTALVAALAGLYLGLAHRDATHLRDANRAGAAGDFTAALHEAGEVDHAPAASRAQFTRAHALFDLGRRREASEAFRLAVSSDPHNWIIHRDWAVVLLGLGRRGQARRELQQARELNPHLIVPLGFPPGG